MPNYISDETKIKNFDLICIFTQDNFQDKEKAMTTTFTFGASNCVTGSSGFVGSTVHPGTNDNHCAQSDGKGINELSDGIHGRSG